MKVKKSHTPTNGTAVLATTTGLNNVMSRTQHPENDMTTSTKDELEMISQQITEINELRKALNALAISTKSALVKAEMAKAKKAAGGSKAVVNAALDLNKEVGMLRINIEALLKDLEANKMEITNGTSRPGSFNLENSKAALVDIKMCYTEIQTIHSKLAPAKQGREEGKIMGMHTKNGSETLRSGSVAQPGTGGESMASQGGEVCKEQGLVTKTKVARVVRGTKAGAVSKGRRKRGRGSGDDESRPGSKTKKAKAIDNESDDSISSALTPAEESSNAGNRDSDVEVKIDLVPPKDGASAVTGHDGVPTSVPQPVPEVHGATGDNKATTVPARGTTDNEDIEMTSIAPVEGLMAQGPVTPQAVSNPTDGRKNEPLPSRSSTETTTDDMADRTADNMADDAATDTSNEAVDDVADDAAGGAAGGEVDEEFDGMIGESNADSEEEDDNDTSDSVTTGSTLDAEGPTKDSSAPTQDNMSEAHDDNMRLAAAADTDDLHNHIITHKTLIKKERKVEAAKASNQPAPEKENKASKPKRDTLRMKWDAMSEEEQDEEQASAKEQVHAFLRNPSMYRIPVHTRAMIREIAEFCIPACQTTRELALHVLENKYHNIFCIYHQTLDKAGHVHNRSGKGAFRVTGTPFPRLTNEKPIKLHPTQAPVECHPGYLHCGCSEDEALLEFYWWKLAEATSPTTDETEGWLDHRKMDPRTRTLMFSFFAAWTHMEVDDIYVGYPINTTFEARMARFDRKVARLQEAKEDEKREEARRVKKEEAQRIKKEQEAVARKKEKSKKLRLTI